MSTHIVKLKNLETHRYAFCPAEKTEKDGCEGGWIQPKTQDHPLLGADANYYNRAMWEVEVRGEGIVSLRNHESRRLIFDQGPKFEGKAGDEGGWIGPNTKKALSADANYYNRAMWKVIPQTNGTVFLSNVETNRLLFDTGDKFEGASGAEGGWVGANIKPLVTVDANYYNRAMWTVEGEPLIKPDTTTPTTPEKNKGSVQLRKHPSKYIVKSAWQHDSCHGHPRAFAEIHPIDVDQNGISGGVIVEGCNGKLVWVYGVNHFAWTGNWLYLFVRENDSEYEASQLEELNKKFPPGTSVTFYKNVQTAFVADPQGHKIQGL